MQVSTEALSELRDGFGAMRVLAPHSMAVDDVRQLWLAGVLLKQSEFLNSVALRKLMLQCAVARARRLERFTLRVLEVGKYQAANGLTRRRCSVAEARVPWS